MLAVPVRRRNFMMRSERELSVDILGESSRSIEFQSTLLQRGIDGIFAQMPSR